jgi:glucose-1-phosphate thymidylyltransferase
LQGIQDADFSCFSPTLDPHLPRTLCLSARTVAIPPNTSRLESILANASGPTPADSPQIVVDQNGHLAATLVPTDSLNGVSPQNLAEKLAGLAQRASSPTDTSSLHTFCHPHDLISLNQQYLADNLQFLIETLPCHQIHDGVFVGPHVSLDKAVSLNTQSGPIFIGEHSRIKAFACLSGPLYIGPYCQINEHASLKDCVCMSQHVKIGGEVEATIVEPYTNKQHYGFLGHSYLGSWVNLGAGNCNSDLKNTYGFISMQLPTGRIDTGRQFVGCFVGDYSKAAINTSIFTGKVIGVCSMLYGFVTRNVPPFVNYAESFGQVTAVGLPVMVATQKRMFDRRNVFQRACDIQLLQDMFELTQSQRPDHLIVQSVQF